MRTKISNPMRFSTNMKNCLKLTILFISMAGIITSCQTADTESPNDQPAAVHVIVYGKVDSLPPLENYIDDPNINPKHLTNYAVLFMPHKYPCSDSTGKSDAVPGKRGGTRIKKSGNYKDLFKMPAGGYLQSMPCFTAVVVANSGLYQSIFDYDSVLAGPIKLGAGFRSHFSVDWSDLDSVRIDFVVHDSTRNSRN